MTVHVCGVRMHVCGGGGVRVYVLWCEGAWVHMCVVWGCMCVWYESACSVRVYVCAHMNGCEVCACVTEKLVRY